MKCTIPVLILSSGSGSRISIRGSAVLSKFSELFISFCRVGAIFAYGNNSGSNMVTLTNCVFMACTEAGVVESRSRVQLIGCDFELIGLNNGGTAIKTGGGTEIRDCHIETSEYAIGLAEHGHFFVENCFIGGVIMA